jgi:hypothetical protein
LKVFATQFSQSPVAAFFVVPAAQPVQELLSVAPTTFELSPSAQAAQSPAPTATLNVPATQLSQRNALGL